MALEGGASPLGVGDDPLAQGQPVSAAVPGRDTSIGTCGDRQRERGASACGLGLEQVADSCFGWIVLVLGGFDCGDVCDGGSNDRFPLAGSEGLRKWEVGTVGLG